MTLRINHSDSNFTRQFEKLLNLREAEEKDVSEIVRNIINDVRDRGNAALIDYTQQFDQVSLTHDTLRLSPARIQEIAAQCASDVRDAIQLAANRIAAYHQKQLPADHQFTDDTGANLGWKWTAISDVGLYVPGGLASYPSSVLMNAIPAKVAGCNRIAMVVPTPEGKINTSVIAAAQIADIDEIYTIGGAQAVSALAYGTASITPVYKIVGPGNAYVAEAKRQVFGKVGIDTIAGPSEILVVADKDNDPSWIAADLLSQAEHDPVAQSILITDDSDFASKVETAVKATLTTLPRADIARASWENYGAIITVDSLENAIPLIDAIAPEHLELAIESPEALATKITNAGAIFLGRMTPEAIGDYIAGPSHVLPTSHAARYSSGLNVLDFMKRTSLIQCDSAAFTQLAPVAATLADTEGLSAHALSVNIRRNK